MKIIILIDYVYTKQLITTFYINEFREKGFIVEIWSVWKLMPYTKKITFNEANSSENIIYFDSRTLLIKKIKELGVNKSFVFNQLYRNFHSFYIYEELYFNKIKWGTLDYYYNPAGHFYYSGDKLAITKSGERMKKILQRMTYLSYYKYNLIKYFNEKHLKGVYEEDVIFITGSNRMGLEYKKNVIAINYFDVENFEIEKTKKPILDYDYIVFADIYLGKHPDLKIKYDGTYLDTDKYYKQLNDFFDSVERITGLPVVIAAHPQSNYTNEFGNHVCLKNVSANLILNSKMLLLHGSLSISYALLTFKKVLFIYNNNIRDNFVMNHLYLGMLTACKYLNIKPYNLDDPSMVLDLDFNVNVQNYENVLQKYFLKNSQCQEDNFIQIYNSLVNLSFNLEKS